MFELSTSVQYVKGVGPRIASLLLNREIRTAYDLLLHFPARYIDRRNIASIKDALAGPQRTVVGEVVTSGVSFFGKRRSRIFEVVIGDGTGLVSGKWFHFHPKYMAARFKKGTRVMFAGDMSQYGAIKQFVHPEVELLDDESNPEMSGRVLPIYPLTEGISQKTFRKIIKNAVDKFHSLIVEPIPPVISKKFELCSLKEATHYLHLPPADADVELLNSFSSIQHRTIIFYEFFMLELSLAMRRAKTTKEAGTSFTFSEELYSKFKSILPFELTAAQQRVVLEIAADMKNPHPMQRLLQGDVGSGKTVVALAAALQAINCGYQTAFMAPTEILAEQHFTTISKLAETLGARVALLTANVKGAERKEVYDKIARGDIDIVVGTHAVIQSEVVFKKLGLAVIDEQHRFGVRQRLALSKKGCNPDILVMTATPIPRTLAMTLYGDLEISTIDQMPSGRKPVVTKVYSDNETQRLHSGMRKELERGHQIYVVYPLIEESEKLDLKNATEMSAELAKIFEPQWKVALLHGRMKSEEKERIMRDFKSGKINMLVATSVVEVGVDVPNATVMVIEHAERFGLAQLHQLRGRVGRGDEQSYCILIVSGPAGEEAKRRLNIMAQTCDGFKIAEEDLSIRGPGEFLGTRQSGIPEFRVADLVRDVGLLQKARQAAFEVISKDPDLKLAEHQTLVNDFKAKGRLDLGSVA